MKRVKLHGDLQQFRTDWELEVQTPGEALRAIEVNRPGFLKAADAGDYIAILVDENNPDLIRQVTLDNNAYPWANEILVVVPRAGGDIPVPMVIAAFAMMSITLSGFAALAVTAIINIGLSLALSALANVITGGKRGVNAGDTEKYDSKPSFISNGPVNVIRAGHPYPIIAGEFLCGSIVLSSQIHVKDIPV